MLTNLNAETNENKNNNIEEAKSKSPKRNIPGSRRNRIDKILRESNTKYIKDIKSNDVSNLKEKKLYAEVERLQKENKLAHKAKLRDEVILDMEKKNQDIEQKLKELKNKDKTDLEKEEAKCKDYWEKINEFFHKKKEEALQKDKIRQEDLSEINKIKANQEKVQKEIEELKKKKKKP